MAKGNIGRRAINSLEAERYLVGRHFGRLFVTRYVQAVKTPNGSSHAIYECQCVCGTVKNVRGNCLKSGKVQSCGCLQREARKRPHTWLIKPKEETALTTRYRAYRNNAQNKKREFSLTREQVAELLQGACFYCGAIPSKPYGNGIDRFINDLDYVPLNCVSCCWFCNMRKGSLDGNTFLNWIDRIHLHWGQLDGENDKEQHESEGISSAR